jgi:hypothetical protein
MHVERECRGYLLWLCVHDGLTLQRACHTKYSTGADTKAHSQARRLRERDWIQKNGAYCTRSKRFGLFCSVGVERFDCVA